MKGKKHLNVTVGINRISQELGRDYGNAEMGKDLSCCRAWSHVQQLSASTLQICYSRKMEKSSPSRHSSCEQGLAESRLGRHAMDEMLILACLTPMKSRLHTNHVVQYMGSGCREDGSFAELLCIFLSKEVHINLLFSSIFHLSSHLSSFSTLIFLSLISSSNLPFFSLLRFTW